MTERVFSINVNAGLEAGLEDSTVTPARTAPDASVTVPTIDAVAGVSLAAATTMSDTKIRIARTHLSMLTLQALTTGTPAFSFTER
jgi:hypothetical protein